MGLCGNFALPTKKRPHAKFLKDARGVCNRLAEIRTVRSLPHGLFVVNLKYGKHFSIPNGKGNKYQAKVLSVGKCRSKMPEEFVID